MATLKKYFVAVPSDKVESFKTAHIGNTVASTDAYYNKIAFLATGEIATHGQLYGSSSDDKAALTAIQAVLAGLGGEDQPATVTAAIEAAKTAILGSADSTNTVDALASRLKSLETLVNEVEEGEDNTTIDKLSEVLTWFKGVAEGEAGATLMTTVAKLDGDASVEGSVAEAKAAADAAQEAADAAQEAADDAQDAADAAQADATAALEAIGDNETADTVLGRVTALEQAASGAAKVTVSAEDGVTLGVGENAVTYKYTHPTTTAADASFVKVGKDAQGHVVLGDAIAKDDLTSILDAGDGTYDAKGSAAAVQGSTTETVASVNSALTTFVGEVEAWDMWETFSGEVTA